MSDEKIELTQQQLEDLMAKAAAAAVEASEARYAAQMARQPIPQAVSDDPEVAGIRRPRPSAQNPIVWTRFDPRRGCQVNPHAREELWNPSRIDRCPCGKVEIAITVEFRGSESIADAKIPVFDIDGNMHQAAWEPLATLPTRYRATKEKWAHMAECKESVRAPLRPMIGPEDLGSPTKPGVIG